VKRPEASAAGRGQASSSRGRTLDAVAGHPLAPSATERSASIELGPGSQLCGLFALLVEVAAARRGRKRALVPDVRMEIDAGLPSDQKATNFSGAGSSPGGPAGTTNGWPSIGQKNWPPSG
jgi:hypothetical protein